MTCRFSASDFDLPEGFPRSSESSAATFAPTRKRVDLTAFAVGPSFGTVRLASWRFFATRRAGKTLAVVIELPDERTGRGEAAAYGPAPSGPTLSFRGVSFTYDGS
jgi:hypothetical protein